MKDGKTDHITREPEQVKAFRDTWRDGIHSYLTYLRDRLTVARDLLADSGSIFVQIGDENVNRVRSLMDEIFGEDNFVALIAYAKTTGFSGNYLSSVCDYLVWFCRSLSSLKYRPLFDTKDAGQEGASKYKPVSTIGALRNSAVGPTRLATSADLTSQGASVNSEQAFRFRGSDWTPPAGLHWKTTVPGLGRIAKAERVIHEGKSIRYVRFMDDFSIYPRTNVWLDVGGVQSRTDSKVYVVQTATEAVKRCMLMTTDPGDLVLDPTCGSGSTAYVAEQWGRRWIEHDALVGLGEPQSEYEARADFATVMLEHLKTSGVQQAHKEDRITFTAITGWPGDYVCAEGRYPEGDKERRAAIFIGPELGTVSRPDLVAAAREAADAGFDVLIACAFNFDAHSAEFEKLGRVPVLKARMNPDLHMADELKNTGSGNLFVVFGEPDIQIEPAGEGRIQVRVQGVDVFRPQTGEIESGGTETIALWMIDTDYNEESFFVRHAYFLGANDPYKALKITLKSEIDPEAWASLNRDMSRPFPKPKSGRIAVKAINHLGDEVMKVFAVA